MRDSSAVTNCASCLGAGRRAPLGGIMPARSLWIIFSVSSRSADARVTSHPASVSSPALLRSLWQPVQYCLTSSACAAAGITAGVCATAGAMGAGAFDAGDCWPPETHLARTPEPARKRVRLTGAEV